MTTWQSWMIWPNNAILSFLTISVVVLAALYAARKPVHAFLRTFTRVLSGPMRLGARWLSLTAQELRQRNQLVLLAHGREEVGQLIAREFERVDVVVRRDLQGYPALQRKLLDEITRIEEDYNKCGEVPPTLPEWVKVVASISKLKPASDVVVEKILTDINKTLNKVHDNALNEYRRAYEARHKILGRFKPIWRSLNSTLLQVDKNLNGLQERSAIIDAQMDKFEQISRKTDKAEHALSASATLQFVIATLVLVVAVGGTVINFNLVALPMSEMVGGSSYIGNFKTADVAALVIILVEAAMGLFLMESLRITHLFPRISYMKDKMRRRMATISFGFLLTLAGIEAALAFMRQQIALDNQALRQSLVIAQNVHASVINAWIPTAGQMVLGFILPFVLAFVALPLESFIYSMRTVAGNLLVLGLRGLALILRLGGIFVRQLGAVVIALYDVIIFFPLLIQGWVERGKSQVSVKQNVIGDFKDEVGDEKDIVTDDERERVI